jgi:hypothetical protein
MKKTLFCSSLGVLFFSLTSCGPKSSLPSPISHGDWISSGGENVKDGNNPWWLKNTKKIKYCIELDPKTFSASLERVTATVDKAFAYWKEEIPRKPFLFNDIFGLQKMVNEIGVGTEEDERTLCDGSEDLRLKFGYGTLTGEERAYVKDPARYIALAVRTQYDEENLKGKGFIFVGSDIGEKRFGLGTQAEKVWEKGLPLFTAVAHELGHVYGIPHTGDRYSLMGANLLELITSNAFAPGFSAMEDTSSLSYFFVPPTHWGGCPGLEPFKKSVKEFFETAEETKCLEFLFNERSKSATILGAAEEASKKKTIVGRLEALNLELYTSLSAGVIAFLTPKQKVFPWAISGFPFDLKFGPVYFAGMGGGKLILANGTEKAIQAHVTTSGLQISGELGGTWKTIGIWTRQKGPQSLD